MAPAPLDNGLETYEAMNEPETTPFSFASSFVSAKLAEQAKLEVLALQALANVCPNTIGDKDIPAAKIKAKAQQAPATVRVLVDEDGNGNKEADDATDVEDDQTDDDKNIAPVVESSTAAARSQSQKKRADYGAFDSWLSRNRDSIAKVTKKAAEALCDDDKTSAALVREFESAKIIESPRDYQIELFEKAKQKNIIAVLDTGASQSLVTVSQPAAPPPPPGFLLSLIQNPYNIYMLTP